MTTLFGKFKRDVARLRSSHNAAPVVLVSVFVALSGATLFGCSSGETNRAYNVTIDNWTVTDASNLAVAFRMTNDGSQPVTPKCDVLAKDASGTELGKDVFTYQTPVAPGATPPVVIHLQVGAGLSGRVDKVLVSCSALTSDTSHLGGSDVKISAVTNCGDSYGAYDPDSKSWYWGACIETQGLAPSTHVTCTEVALDSSGKELTRNTFPGVTLNDGTVTSYGQNSTSFPDTTKQIAMAIDTVTATCTL
ncbi:unannotated protein [freshwater metagenome]|uniref:Unannotated protein n=1 Tax=freshwater metagenome TaxID=449393 RepID=A0A6J7GQS5_9ZZZZ